MQTFTIKGRLPSANEFIRWDRIRGAQSMRIKFWGAKKRREAIYHVWACIKRAELVPFAGQVRIAIRWIEGNRRRDYDNIASSVKFILDALVKAQIIKGDSRRWIPSPVVHEFALDPMDPRIEVTIDDQDLARPEMHRPAQAETTDAPLAAHPGMQRGVSDATST